MSQRITFFFWLILSLLAPGVTFGGDLRELTVELSYSGSAASYNLYKNNIFTCNRPNGPQLSCIVALDATPMAFVLTAVDATGVESMPSAPFMLDPLPQANFTATVNSGGAPLSINFDASASSDYGGFITSYAWNFGDGGVGTGQYIDHTFAATGTYAVRLAVVNDMGVGNEVVQSITVMGEFAGTASPTVPASDADGSYSVNWSASATAGVSYTLEEATNSAFTAGVRTAYSGTGLSTTINGRLNGVTYYYRVKATLPGYTDSAWSSGANGCVVTIRAGAPLTLTVPASDADGSYPISWSASTTAGVSYTLEEATNSAFTAGVRTAYSGTGLSTTINGRLNGVTYYYRVMATLPGYAGSTWSSGANGCVVTIRAGASSSLTVPASDADGSYPISWSASTTAGVSYTLEEATNSAFTAGVRTAYSGTALTTTSSGRLNGVTYYYRVMATRTGYAGSTWSSGANGCVVTIRAGAPSTLAVLASDADGSYSVNWSASATAGVSYTLEEATNSTFTAGGRTAYSGTALTSTISGRSSGVTYYYRVMATRSGYTGSVWRNGANGCVVTIRAGAPSTLAAPASDADGSYPVSWLASATAGVSYTLQEATNSTFTAGVRTAYSGTALTTTISRRSSGVTYYYRVMAIRSGYTGSVWRNGANGCVVTIRAGAPFTLTVPASDADGSYLVNWSASVTIGANYILQEATNSTFTAGLRSAYSGAALSTAISGRLNGVTYYYRVMATRTGYTGSTWTRGAGGCVVTIRTGTPSTLTVPINDADGSYPIRWAASATAGVRYTLQEATNSTFTAGVRTAYSGTALSTTISGRLRGVTYYYRVMATRTGYTGSTWTTAAQGCVIGPMQSVTYTWDYAETVSALAGFKLYMNGTLVCQTSNRAVRSLTCNVPKSVGAKSFHLTAIGVNAIETTPSNSLQVTL